MAEELPKFEKITKEIEKFPSAKKEEEEKQLEFSPQEKAEQVWAFWNEYRQKKYEFLIEEKGKPREERTPPEEIEQNPELLKLKEEISERWQDKGVQGLFKKHLKENIREREKVFPDLENYHQRENEFKKAREEYENLLKKLFIHRAKEPDELSQINLAWLAVKIDVLKDNLDKTFQENPELASFIQYEKIKDYHRQFEKTGFIWVPSREKLFNNILEHIVLLNKNRPMFLTGETGTGKTRLAREAIERLTAKPAYEIGEEAKSDIRPLLGSAWIEKDKTFVVYGPLGQAITGKKNSLEKESDGGGIFYMDEMNGYPPDALRSLIKQISGRSPGEEVTFAAWRGIWEKIAEKSGLIGSANLPSEKHPDRSDLPVEITRELTTLEVDYPEQTKENPELYEMLLGALMDRNGRIRLKEGETEPAWLEKVDARTKEKIKELNPDLKSGGTLWRFAGLIAQIQKSYKGEENVLTPHKGDASYLRAAVLDPGITLGWLKEYRISVLRKGRPLKEFLREKLKNWQSQKTYPREDRDLLKEFFGAYDLPIEGPDVQKSDAREDKIWSESELGFLSPRTPRPKEKIESPKPIFKTTFLEDGTEIEYLPLKEQAMWLAAGNLLGKTPDNKYVFEELKTKTVKILEEEEFRKIIQETIKEKLEEEKKDSPSFGEKIEKMVEFLTNRLPKSKQKSYRKNLENQLAKLPPEEKIKYIAKQF